MQGCNEQVCRIRRNTLIPIRITFLATHRSQSVLSSNHLLVNDQWFTMSPRRPMCPHLVFGRCPLIAGNHYTFRYTTALAREFAIGFRTTMRIFSPITTMQLSPVFSPKLWLFNLDIDSIIKFTVVMIIQPEKIKSDNEIVSPCQFYSLTPLWGIECLLGDSASVWTRTSIVRSCSIA